MQLGKLSRQHCTRMSPLPPKWANCSQSKKWRQMKNITVHPHVQQFIGCMKKYYQCHNHWWRIAYQYGRCGRCHTNLVRATPTATACPFFIIDHINFYFMAKIMFWPYQLWKWFSAPGHNMLSYTFSGFPPTTHYQYFLNEALSKCIWKWRELFDTTCKL